MVQISLQISGEKNGFLREGSMEPHPLGTNGSKSTLVTNKR